MSQYSFGNLESPLTGEDLIDTHLEPWRDAVHSNHSGTSRPSYASACLAWVDTTTTPWVWKIFDGTDDITIGTVNATTNLFTPSGLVKDNTTTSAPTTGDDTGDGYSVGSVWINTSTDLVYVCTDATLASAVWKLVIDSNSSQTLSGKTLTDPIINAAGGSLILPQGTSPAQTAEGEMFWDTDNDLLTVGTASARKVMVDTDSTQTLTNKSMAVSSLTSGTMGSGVGVSSGDYSLGTITTGTVTPNPQTQGPMPYYTNNGAHTLAVPASLCTMVIEITNGASAGTITIDSGYDVSGDAFTTTNGARFIVSIIKHKNSATLNVEQVA